MADEICGWCGGTGKRSLTGVCGVCNGTGIQPANKTFKTTYQAVAILLEWEAKDKEKIKLLRQLIRDGRLVFKGQEFILTDTHRLGP